VVFNRTSVVLWACPPKMELGAAFSKIKGKDARRDFILLNGVVEEGSLLEGRNGRETQAKDPRRYE
jgi:hypothetical protein